MGTTVARHSRSSLPLSAKLYSMPSSFRLEPSVTELSRFLFALIALLFIMHPARAEDFPQPPELKPDVDFWVSIFTRYSTGEGVLHDSRNLSVVYERIDVPPKASRRERNRIVGQRRKAISAVLERLASGKRENLTAEEARILGLWPDNVSNATLRAAKGQIRFQLGLSDRFREGLERSGRWRSFVQSEMSSRGVPIDLVALPHVESSYNPDARSHVGASGIWQFTRSTGRRFMRVDHVVDERNDPFSATSAAAELLSYNYSITGNWPMAITAYNHGLAGVRRAMRKFGDTAYVDILRNYKGRTFGFASRNFYVAFLAAREADRNADKYFPGFKYEDPVAYSTTKLSGYLPVAKLSSATGISERRLARYNPSWQPTIWQGSKHIPKGQTVRLPSASLNSSLDELLSSAGDGIWADEQLPDMFHRVARGDTLSEIAETYKTRVSTLVALNGLGSRHRIRIGQQIRLPAAGPAPAVVAAEALPAPVPEVDAEAAAVESVEVADVSEPEPTVMSGETVEAVAATSAAASTQTELLSDPSDYTVAEDSTIEVHPQETLGHYADWLGIRTQRLRDLNGMAFRTPVEVGKRIRLRFDDVDRKTFESRRIAYHRQLQDAFFREHMITGVAEHTIRRGESVWVLSLRDYDVPIWLFRQYNPGLDPKRVQPGTRIRFPVFAKQS